jgi:hypothetical protein
MPLPAAPFEATERDFYRPPAQKAANYPLTKDKSALQDK